MGTFFDEVKIKRLENAEDGSTHNLDFSERTSLWSVNGGYLAAAILRCIEDISVMQMPANLSLNYLAPVMPGSATAKVESIKRSEKRRLELFDAKITSAGKTAVLAQAWATDPRNSIIVDDVRMPQVPHPEELVSVKKLHENKAPRHKFWDVFDERQINGLDIGTRHNRQPRSLRWMKYNGDLTEKSPFVTAGLTIPIIDMLGVPAGSNARGESILTSLAPTIHLAAHFYQLGELSGWILGDAYSEHVGQGLINSRVRIWTIDGYLAAQGICQMAYTSGEGAYVAGRT